MISLWFNNLKLLILVFFFLKLNIVINFWCLMRYGKQMPGLNDELIGRSNRWQSEKMQASSRLDKVSWVIWQGLRSRVLMSIYFKSLTLSVQSQLYNCRHGYTDLLCNAKVKHTYIHTYIHKYRHTYLHTYIHTLEFATYSTSRFDHMARTQTCCLGCTASDRMRCTVRDVLSPAQVVFLHTKLIHK